MSSSLISMTGMSAVVFSMGPGLPLLLALFCTVASLRKKLVVLLPWAVLPTFLTVFWTPVGLEVDVPWFFMGGRMGLDATSQAFLGAAAFIWFIAGVSARRQLADFSRPYRFAGFFWVAMAGNFGLLLARDVLGFYLFFTMMSLASYGLIAVGKRSAQSRGGLVRQQKAGTVYLVLMIIGEVAMFAALAMLADNAGSMAIGEIRNHILSLPVLLLIFVAFGVKVGAAGLHVWMPLVYQEAPVPAAAALAGAMINAGLFGWLRFLPLGHSAFPDGGIMLMAIGAFGAFYGVISGLCQKRPGAILGYSSMSQMGLMTFLVGFGLLSRPAGLLAVSVLTLFGIHHGLCKASLFLGIDAARSWIGRHPRWIQAGLLLPGLSLAGMPLTSGAVAKTAAKELVAVMGSSWAGMGLSFLLLSSIATTFLVLHFVRVVSGVPDGKEAESRVIPAAVPAIWIGSLAAVAGAFWIWPMARIPAHHSLDGVKLWMNVWPVLLGVALFAGWRSTAGRIKGDFSLPEGDYLVLGEQLWTRFCRAGIGEFFGTFILRARLRLERARQYVFISLSMGARLGKGDKILTRWSVVGFCYLQIVLLVYFLFS